jgi:hypothetical protein
VALLSTTLLLLPPDLAVAALQFLAALSVILWHKQATRLGCNRILQFGQVTPHTSESRIHNLSFLSKALEPLDLRYS